MKPSSFFTVLASKWGQQRKRTRSCTTICLPSPQSEKDVHELGRKEGTRINERVDSSPLEKI